MATRPYPTLQPHVHLPSLYYLHRSAISPAAADAVHDIRCTIPLHTMNLSDPLKWGYPGTYPTPTSQTVCGVTGCGERHGKAHNGDVVLWGCWVCKKHFTAFQRGTSVSPTTSFPHRPPQPTKGRGRGIKPTPASMGVTVEDLIFMFAMVQEVVVAKAKVRTAVNGTAKAQVQI